MFITLDGREVSKMYIAKVWFDDDNMEIYYQLKGSQLIVEHFDLMTAYNARKEQVVTL